MFDLLALPSGLLVHDVASNLDTEDLWRLRCTCTKVQKLLMNGMSPMDIICATLNLTIMLHGKGFNALLCSRDFMNMALERSLFDRMGPLEKWLTTNRVHLDTKGFYSPLCTKGEKVKRDTPRVRIGLWETGVCIELIRRSLVRNPVMKTVVWRSGKKAVVVPGFRIEN
jgi:hypothetical protein